MLPFICSLFILRAGLSSFWCFCNQFSHVQLFVTSWTAARQAPLSITNSWSLLKLMSIKSVMPSNHLILCHPPSPPAFNLSQHQGIFQWVRSSHQVAKVLELQLQHQSFQWIQDWSLLGWTGWISLQSKGLSRASQTLQFKSINFSVLSLLYRPALTPIRDY